MLHKKKPPTIKKKQKHITYICMKTEAHYLYLYASEYSYNRYFLSSYLHM